MRTRLENAAKTNENMMPLFIECVENNLTLGEICNTLRGVWGDGEAIVRGFSIAGIGEQICRAGLTLCDVSGLEYNPFSNSARLTADAKRTYDFVAALYESNQFSFDKLVPWLRRHAKGPDRS